MNKFLQTHNLPRVDHEEIENANRSITIRKTESVTKNLPTKKSPGSESSTGEVYRTFKELIQIPSKLLPKNRREKKQQQQKPEKDTSKLILKGQNWADTKTRQGYQNKGNCSPISLKNIDEKFSTKY